MRRVLLPILLVVTVVLAACSGGGKSTSHASGTTTTTDATAYVTAYTVCLQFYNTEKLRNAVPQGITDREADDIFVGLALQLKPAVQKDPSAWAKLNKVATTLRTQLLGTKATDQQIDDSIEKMHSVCAPARKAPPQSQIEINVSTTTSTTALPA